MTKHLKTTAKKGLTYREKPLNNHDGGLIYTSIGLNYHEKALKYRNKPLNNHDKGQNNQEKALYK